jgi:hypothetical protein
MSGGTGAIAVTVSGNFNNPNFSFTVAASGYEDLNFAGSLSGTAPDWSDERLGLQPGG